MANHKEQLVKDQAEEIQVTEKITGVKAKSKVMTEVGANMVIIKILLQQTLMDFFFNKSKWVKQQSLL